MLLRLVPPNPTQLSVTFSVAYKPTLPPSIVIPPGWATQLQKVMQDDLDPPACLHALDKAAWGVSLLQEVTFNAALRTVKCIFVDGSRMDWPILDSQCLHTLHGVLQDVNTSCHAADQERDRGRTKDISSFPFSRPSSPAPTAGKQKQHKRSRSFLMTLVASLVPSSRPSSPVQQEFAEIVPPQQEPEHETAPNTDQRGTLKQRVELSRSRLLRRQARATLIDVFRLYILPHLNSPFPHGGYPFWAIRSTLYNVEARMDYIVQNTGLDPTSILRLVPSPSPSLLSESPFTDNDSLTDTDDSSVHTPQDSFAEPPFYYQPNLNGEDGFIDLESGLPRTPSPPKTPPMAIVNVQPVECGPADEYARLNHSSVLLQAMMQRSIALEAEASMENKTMLTILEIKSRRRAWTNVALMGRSVAELSGLGTPSRSSPLARVPPTTPETLANERLERHRLSTISEDGSFPEDIDSDEDFSLDMPPFSRPPVLNCIPFPQTEDFCSTAPQDLLPLFTPPDNPTDLPPAYRADPCNPPIPFDSHPNDFDRSSQTMSDEFTLALDLKTKPRGHRRVGAKQIFYERDGWISTSPLIC